MIKFTAINDNFWTAHPDLAIVQPFKDLFLNDLSKNKKTTSDMMWFVVLCYDRDSKYNRLPPDGDDGKHILISGDFLGDINYYLKHESELDSLIDRYKELQLSATERQVVELDETMDARRGVIKELRKSKNPSDWKELDKMLVGTKKITDEIDKIKKLLAEEQSQGLAKGGAAPSLND